MRLYIVPLVTVLMAGCGGTEETTRIPPPPPTPPAPVTQPAQPEPEFETSTDTVAGVYKTPAPRAPSPHHVPQIRFMVQIGAFKDPENASHVQTLARERYHLPVVNDYHTKLALYQIRIGFFETRGEANAFREKMHQEFPADYKDPWVVQLKR